MRCPQCGYELPTGAVLCPSCGARLVGPPGPAAVPSVPTATPTPAPSAPPPAVPGPAAPSAPPRRRRLGCLWAALGVLGGLAVLLCVLVGLWWFVGRPALTQWLVNRYAPTVAENLDFSRLKGQTWRGRVSEADLNRSVGSVAGGAGPLQAIWIELDTGEVQLHLRAYGVDNSLAAHVAARGGHLEVSDARAGGILILLIEPGIITERVEAAVNAELDEQRISLRELRVTAVDLELAVAPR